MASWGRHGWPRKNEGLRIYKESKGSYFLVDPESHTANYDAVVNVFEGSKPSLVSGTVHESYLRKGKITRVQWCELPENWQKAFSIWLDEPPEEIRGFWLVGKQPVTV